MTRTKDDEPIRQLTCVRDDVALELRDPGIVEMKAKTADDAHKSDAPLACELQKNVQLLAVALTQT